MEESFFSSVIDLLFNVAAFVYVGAWMPFSTFQNAELTLSIWRLIVIAILILILRWLPVMITLYKWIPDIKTFREAIFSRHFGPIGIGAIFISTLANEIIYRDHNPHSHQVDMLADTIQPIVAFMVLCSITIHGLSIPSLSLGRCVHTVSRTWSRQAGASDWTNQTCLVDVDVVDESSSSFKTSSIRRSLHLLSGLGKITNHLEDNTGDSIQAKVAEIEEHVKHAFAVNADIPGAGPSRQLGEEDEEGWAFDRSSSSGDQVGGEGSTEAKKRFRIRTLRSHPLGPARRASLRRSPVHSLAPEEHTLTSTAAATSPTYPTASEAHGRSPMHPTPLSPIGSTRSQLTTRIVECDQARQDFPGSEFHVNTPDSFVDNVPFAIPSRRKEFHYLSCDRRISCRAASSDPNLGE
ncbi:putative Na(+)/H(+) antiporter C3A11.09 [Hypsizygus marmoreus]|uniref:Na(+)/H(+) antiporter C3A11.09 n=1 Tax=Hypsizygus marmoreus TaxID=39966 RepID=A0A369J811_HYPMA|nr:putative Na(+)/H(+) antiporter C3A11.09 [Hypsizygus marmoreus]